MLRLCLLEEKVGSGLFLIKFLMIKILKEEKFNLDYMGSNLIGQEILNLILLEYLELTKTL